MTVMEALKRYIKNMEPEAVTVLAEQVGYMPGQIVSKTLAQNKAVSLTLFAFDKGEEISNHESSGDAMVIVLDGTGEITIGEEKYLLGAGETIIMPAGKPHAVFAAERFKMFLIVIFPQ
jgi:quercetin dioxygenase-like cupin family protein